MLLLLTAHTPTAFRFPPMAYRRAKVGDLVQKVCREGTNKQQGDSVTCFLLT